MPFDMIQQFVGAFIAGIIGLLTQAVAIHTRRSEEKDQWEERLRRLCNRIESDLGDDPEDDDILVALYTYLDVIPLLESHISDAPFPLSEEAVDTYEEIFRYKRHYGTRNHVSGSVNDAENVREISEKAEKLRKEAIR